MAVVAAAAAPKVDATVCLTAANFCAAPRLLFPPTHPFNFPQVAEALRDARLALMKDLRKEEDAEAYDALAKVGSSHRIRAVHA